MTWSVHSDTGVLREVLLCRPDYYKWMPLNEVAKETLAAQQSFDLQAAQSQYEEMVDALEQAGVTCHYLEPEPHLSYQVYARDSSQMTPWGAAITQLAKPERRGEYAAVLRHYQPRDAIWQYCTDGTLEGGDIHLIKPGVLLVGYSGGRSDERGARQLGDWFKKQGWEVRLEHFAEHFLHMDLLFAMAADDLAVACVEVLEDEFVRWLSGHGVRLIHVAYKDAMTLGCNVLALGGERVISPRHNEHLNGRLRAEGLAVFDPELDIFTRGGGGPRCLTMPLKRDES